MLRTPSARTGIAPLLVASSLLAVACGGGSDSSADGTPPAASATADDASSDPMSGDAARSGGESDGGQSAALAGPIDGALVSLLSQELGLYALDAASGSWSSLVIDDVGFTDRNAEPIVVGRTAYTVGFTPLPDQSFSHEVSIVAVDLDTGAGGRRVELGVDRANDDATDSTSFDLLAVVGVEAGDREAIVAVNDNVGGTLSRSLQRFSVATGEPLGELGVDGAVPWSFESDDASCSNDVRVIGADGDVLYGMVGALPATIDVATGTVEPLVPVCTPSDGILPTLISPADLAPYITTRSGRELTAEEAERLLALQDPDADGTPTIADGALWWVSTRVVTLSDDETVMFGALVRLDRTTGDFTLTPLGDVAGEFLDDDSGFTTSTLQATVVVVDGAVWLVDQRDDQPLVRVDLGSGTIEAIPIALGTARGEPANTVRAAAITTDPGRLWLRVDQGIREENADGSASTRFEQYLQLRDSETGAVLHEIAVGDIIG